MIVFSEWDGNDVYLLDMETYGEYDTHITQTAGSWGNVRTEVYLSVTVPQYGNYTLDVYDSQEFKSKYDNLLRFCFIVDRVAKNYRDIIPINTKGYLASMFSKSVIESQRSFFKEEFKGEYEKDDELTYKHILLKHVFWDVLSLSAKEGYLKKTYDTLNDIMLKKGEWKDSVTGGDRRIKDGDYAEIKDALECFRTFQSE